MERNAFNHVGLVVENLNELHRRMTEAGLDLPKGIQRHPDGNCLMVQAPDRVLLELFEPNRQKLTPRLAAWFEMEPSGTRTAQQRTEAGSPHDSRE